MLFFQSLTKARKQLTAVIYRHKKLLMMDDPVYNTIDNDVTLIDILLTEIF